MPKKSNSPKPEEKKPPAKPKKVMAAKGGKNKEETALETASTSQTTTPIPTCIELAKNPEFLEGFWKGSNGNLLVKSLNQYAKDKGLEDRIRREKESPVVYGIVINNGDFPFKEKGLQWKLCKVGFTQKSIKKDTSNRMEQLMKEINLVFKSETAASVLFALPIGAVNTKSFHDTEVGIRAKVGKPVLKKKVQDIGLPVPTEWVLTTQQHIDKLKEMIDNKKEEVKKNGEGDVIEAFKDIKVTPDPPENRNITKNGWA